MTADDSKFVASAQCVRAMSAIGFLLLWPSNAWADGTADQARAETLFEAAKELQGAGQVSDACAMFAESKRLALGVGVTLHLANCYERAGRPASAWREFQDGERQASARGDGKRASLAHARAQALLPKVNRLTVVASRELQRAGAQIVVDGAALPAERWNIALTVDPGDHVVTVESPGRPARKLVVHVDEAKLVAEVQADEPLALSPSATTVTPPALSPTQQATEPVHSTVSMSGDVTPSNANSARLGIELGLVGAGVLGAGLGTFFLIRRNVLAGHNCSCDPSLEGQASTAATIAFAASGAALASSLAMFLTAPAASKPRIGWAIAPAPVAGGAGAIFRASF